MSATTASERLAGDWTFNQTHSAVTFSIQYLVNAFRGSFGDVEAKLEDGELAGSAKVASISVKDENLIGHLQGPDFFDAERHPELSFRSGSLDIQGDRVELDGELTIKGITRPVHATGTVSGPVDDPMGRTRLGFTLETTIDRTEYGIAWNLDLPKGGKALADEVKLTVELEFNR